MDAAPFIETAELQKEWELPNLVGSWFLSKLKIVFLPHVCGKRQRCHTSDTPLLFLFANQHQLLQVQPHSTVHSTSNDKNSGKYL